MSDAIITVGDEHPFPIVFGDDWDPVFSFTEPNGDPINLTGFGALLVVKQQVDSAIVLVTLTDAAGITMGGAAGTAQPLIDKATTLSWMGLYPRLEYAFQLTDTLGREKTKFSGQFINSRKTTS